MFLLWFYFLVVFDKISVFFGKFNNINIYIIFNLLIFYFIDSVYFCLYIENGFKLDINL